MKSTSRWNAAKSKARLEFLGLLEVHQAGMDRAEENHHAGAGRTRAQS